jgi:hypothetical protein
MIWEKDVKEHEIRLSHWERVSKEYRPEINLKTVMLKFLRNRGKKHSAENKWKRYKRSR